MRPAIPGLIGTFARQTPQPLFVRPLLERLAPLKVFQAAAWIAVAFCGWQLLRLRPWARVAVGGVCWFFLAYSVCFGALSAVAWTRAGQRLPAEAPGRALHVTIGLVALTLGSLDGVALVAMILRLRSPGVREAFGRLPAKGAPADP